MTETGRSPSLARTAGLLLLVAGSAVAGGLVATARRPAAAPLPSGPSALAVPKLNLAPGPVARVAGEAIESAELEAAVAAALERSRERHQQQLAEEGKKLVEPQLRLLIEERLIARAARERGVAADDFVAQAAGVTREDAVRFLEQNAKRPGLEVTESLVARAMSSLTHAKRKEILAELRGRYAVEVLLEPERTAVEVAGAPTRGGSASAPVEVVIFSDFECPFCARLVPTLEAIEARYGEQVEIAFRQFPLTNIHPRAHGAAEAALCAHEQGRFWEFHDALFANQKALGSEALLARASALGLDAGRFEACLADNRMAARVRADLEAGRAAGVSGTPALFVNGRRLDGARPVDEIAALIDDELARSRG